MLGLSVLLAFALRGLRERFAADPPTPGVPVCSRSPSQARCSSRCCGAARPVSAAVPTVNRIIAEDPRPVRVVNLPFGLRDGLTRHGNATAAGQYFQTVHEKQLLGGYVSRAAAEGADIT